MKEGDSRMTLSSNHAHSGMQFALARQTFIIGYAILAAGVFIVLLLIMWCVHLCFRKKESSTKDENDAAHQLAQLYAD
jgi:hypothetical protein